MAQNAAAESMRGGVPAIAIVGRPNVGKSSLFNAIVGRRLSIVHEMSGVTRDRVVAPLVRNGRRFELIDTGGLGMLTGESRKVDVWDSRIAAQVELAIEGADVREAIHNREWYGSLTEEKIESEIRTGAMVIALSGTKTGIVNGLAVMDRGSS